jgi:hypothetical protein
MSKKYAFIIALLVIGIASRFIPHYPNFTAIGSMALLGGAMLRKPLAALALPLIALFVSDLVINNVMYPGATFTLFYEGAIYIYAATVLTVLLARLVNKVNVKNYLGLAIVSSVLFFLLTNFGVWQSGLLYAKTMSGLMACYAAAIPYALSQLAGTVLYGGAIMVAYNALTQQRSLEFQRL